MSRLKYAFVAAASALVAPLALAQDVKVEKYSLPNGMTVILHEDHSLPTVVVNTWYRVGAQDEPPGRSGFAHLFEHLMFMGTNRVPGNQFDILMETGGGANNASTDLHRTNYFSWGPSTLLPTLLWLDADRLEDMGLTMSQDKLNKQRDVVRNELRQTVENSPYGVAGEMVYKLMYTPDHPYYYGVIGTHEDLEAASVTNVKDFFATFYVPSNASLVVAGDFDPKVVKPMIAGLFGTLPGGAPVTRKYAAPTEPIPVKLAAERRFTCIDRVELPKVQYVYHSPRGFGEGDAEMILAAEVLAGGKSSRLYNRLVIQDQLAAEVDATQLGYPLGGLFMIDVLAKPGADLAAVERAMNEELAKFLKDGPTAQELQRVQASVELAKVNALQSVMARADALNEYEYFWGEPNSFKRDLERFRSATPASITTWAGRTFAGNKAVIHVLPAEPQRDDSPRDQRPADLASAAFTPPAPTTFTLPGGLPVVLFERHDLPLVSFMLLGVPGGGVDPAGKEGLGALAAKMLSEGAGDLDTLAFENAVQSLGAEFNAGADTESAAASMTVLSRNLDKAAPLFADAVLRPRFDSSAWERVKGLHLDEVNQGLEEPRSIAARVSAKLLYAPGNPYATPQDGTIESVQAITLEDAKAAVSSRLFPPTGATLYIAGDVTKERVQQVFGPLLSGFKGGGKRAETSAAAAGGGGGFGFAKAQTPGLRVGVVDRPGATQTFIRFAAPGVPLRDGSRVQRELLNTALGGSFTSRLNQNLREDHGYTYGARSNFAMGPSTGAFTAGASVQAEVTGKALVEFLKEFDRIRTGDIADAEVAKARETRRSDLVRSFGQLSGLLGAASEFEAAGLPYSTLASDIAAAEKASAGELNALARTAVNYDQGVLVLVGDKATILEQLKDVPGLPAPTIYEPTGEPVK
jgi:predicted Zn-dependent peptidase